MGEREEGDRERRGGEKRGRERGMERGEGGEGEGKIREGVTTKEIDHNIIHIHVQCTLSIIFDFLFYNSHIKYAIVCVCTCDNVNVCVHVCVSDGTRS